MPFPGRYKWKSRWQRCSGDSRVTPMVRWKRQHLHISALLILRFSSLCDRLKKLLEYVNVLGLSNRVERGATIISAMASCRVTRSQNADGSRIQSCNFASIEYLALSRSLGLQNSFSPSKVILLSSPTDIASFLRIYGKFQDTKIKGILVTYKICEIFKVESPDHNFLIDKKESLSGFISLVTFIKI